MAGALRFAALLVLLLGFATCEHCEVRGAWTSAATAPFNVAKNAAGSLVPRLRGGSSAEIDGMCAIDPTRLAGVGIGFKKDKVSMIFTVFHSYALVCAPARH